MRVPSAARCLCVGNDTSEAGDNKTIGPETTRGESLRLPQDEARAECQSQRPQMTPLQTQGLQLDFSSGTALGLSS